jgi:DNA-binding transcriptional ArsR family regulator
MMSVADPRWVRAISHPLRIRLLAMLDEEPASPVVLAGKLGQSLGTVSYHVRTLFDLGLLDLVSTRQRRGATEHIYKARPHPRFTGEGWDELGTIPKQRMITAALSQIHDYASRSAAAGGFDGADAQLTHTPLRLDEQGWSDLAQATRTWLAQAEQIERESAKRVGGDAGPALDAGLVILLFEALSFRAGMPQLAVEPRNGEDRRLLAEAPSAN